MWAGFGIALVFLGLFTLVTIAAWFTARDLFRLIVGLGGFAVFASMGVYVMFEVASALWGAGGYWATLLGLTGLLFAGMFAVVKWGN